MKKRLRDLRADVIPACLIALLVLACFAMAQWSVRADNGSGDNAIINCSPGNPDCKIFKAQGDCFVDVLHQHGCNSDANCHCRWVPGPNNGQFGCFCLNTSGN